MKDCKKIHSLLPLYIEEQLSSSEKGQVEKHLSICITAQRELEHFRHLLMGLNNMPEPQVPADLHTKIMERLGHAAPPLPKTHPFWGLPVWALTAAAVLVFVLLNQTTDWRDTLRVQKPKQTQDEVAPAAPKASTNQAPRSAAPPPMAQLTFQKNLSTNKDANPDIQMFGANKNKKSEETGRNFSLAKPEEETTLGLAEKDLSKAEPEAGITTGSNDFAQIPPTAAPLAKRSKSLMSKARPKAEAAGASSLAMEAENKADLPAAAPAPSAPRADQLDQSMKSLPYSKEQNVVTWNGNTGPSTVESQELVTDAETFQKYWQIPHPGEAPPTVDFTKDAVVILNAGEKPTAGYSIQVSRLEEKVDQLVIHYRVDTPPQGSVTAQIITHPWVLQIIPKPSKPVVFVKDL